MLVIPRVRIMKLAYSIEFGKQCACRLAKRLRTPPYTCIPLDWAGTEQPRQRHYFAGEP